MKISKPLSTFRFILASALVCLGIHWVRAEEWTTDLDHQNMMEQLGIESLRPGADGWAKAGESGAANYEESSANPYSNLPDALILENGGKVRTESVWWIERRPEIVDAFEREVYGRVPENVPGVEWKLVDSTTEGTVDGVPVLAKRLEGQVDNASYPKISVTLRMTLVLPRDAKGAVPALVMFHPLDWELPDSEGLKIPQMSWPQPETDVPPSPVSLIRNGWAYVFLNTQSVQADNGAGLRQGIIGLTNKGEPRSPEDWGALRAWAWGASRAIDYLETETGVDALKIGIEGVSRYGKAALVALAFEPRFAMGLIGSSGKGGVTLHRRYFGEQVSNLTGGGGYHWMAGNYLKYAAERSAFGRLDASALPVDSHQLLALCAPRLCFVSYGIPEQGDALWLDQQGSFMATVAAQPVYALLGAKGLGVEESYMAARMPPVEQGLLNGALAWRQHAGGHEDRSNMQHFIDWAEAQWED